MLVSQTLEQRLTEGQVGFVSEGLETGLPAVVSEDVDEVLEAGGAVGLARRLDEDCGASV